MIETGNQVAGFFI